MVEHHINNGNRPRALASLERMRALILGRSREQVRAMEIKAGLL